MEKVMLKQRFVVILFFLTMPSFFIFPDSPPRYFPEDIKYNPVFLYLQEKEILDNYQAYNEYIYILTFLEEAMEAHEANVRNYHAESTLIKLRPILKDGSLIIEEAVSKIYYSDNTTNLMYERLDVYVIAESINFIGCIDTYNDLLYFWFEKTGEMLRTELDFYKEIKRIDDPWIHRMFKED